MTKTGKLLLGAGTYTTRVRLAIPSHWEIAGVGSQTVIRAADGLQLACPEGMLVNSAFQDYEVSRGHNTGIVIHDLTVDGNAQGGSGIAGLSFAGADNSEIYSVRFQNFQHCGLDLRNGSNDSVHDCFADGSAATEPWHAFGGGVGNFGRGQTLGGGIFRHNKFCHNRAVGGKNDFDAFDINGNMPGAVAEDNEISDNTMEAVPIGIFVDSCAKTLVKNNKVLKSPHIGIAVTSGRRLARQNTITGNEITRAGGVGILLGNQANENAVAKNIIEQPGEEGILITDASHNQIQDNVIRGPGESRPGSYAGIRVTLAAPGFAAENQIQRNQILDVQRRMQYGILIQNAHGGTAYQNVVADNFITGGQPGNSGRGVQDDGRATSATEGQWKPNPRR